MLILKFFNTGP